MLTLTDSKNSIPDRAVGMLLSSEQSIFVKSKRLLAVTIKVNSFAYFLIVRKVELKKLRCFFRPTVVSECFACAFLIQLIYLVTSSSVVRVGEEPIVYARVSMVTL